MKYILIGMIRVYQLLPFSSHSKCRFVPTCSNYGIEAIKRFAATQHIMPYIVIGRLQKEKKLEYRCYSNYKLRYKWAE